MSLLNKTLTIAIALMVLVAPVSGQGPTSYGGDYNDGASIDIGGSGFGSKSPAAPHIWANFESGTIGTKVESPLVGTFDDHNASNNFYSGDHAWSGSRSSKWQTNVGSGRPGYHLRWSNTAERYGFISFKWYITSTEGNTYQAIHLKLIRLQSQSVNYTSGVPNWDIGMDRGSTTFQGIANHGPSDPVEDFYIGGFNTPPYLIGAWNSVSIAMDVGGTFVNSNAKLWRAINGSHTSATNRKIIYSSYSIKGLRGALCMALVDDISYNVRIYIDDLYVDNTLSRVVLADAATWGATTRREMQIPTDWNDNNITITANTGTFSPGDQAWLYVFNAAGDTGTPLTITIGDTGGGVEPTMTAPFGISVTGGYGDP